MEVPWRNRWAVPILRGAALGSVALGVASDQCPSHRPASLWGVVGWSGSNARDCLCMLSVRAARSRLPSDNTMTYPRLLCSSGTTAHFSRREVVELFAPRRVAWPPTRTRRRRPYVIDQIELNGEAPDMGRGLVYDERLPMLLRLVRAKMRPGEAAAAIFAPLALVVSQSADGVILHAGRSRIALQHGSDDQRATR